MNIILKAEHQNWGLKSIYDWDTTYYELSRDGNLHLIVKYFEPVMDCVVKISETDLEKIKSLIPHEPIGKCSFCCDGTAWSFTAYDEQGKVTFYRDVDYIYGIESLTSIGNILESYNTYSNDFKDKPE